MSGASVPRSVDPSMILAVLVSALLHAAWNALLRSHPDRRAGGVAVVAVAAAVAAAAAIAWTRDPFPGGLLPTCIAGVFEAGYMVSLQRGFAAGGLGPVYTISRGGSLAIVWPLSVAMLGEGAHAIAI